jgi:hypothetical protein
MRSSHTISLFSERPELNQWPSSFVISVLAHGAAVALLSFGIIYTPEISNRVVTKRYSVRHLELHTPKSQLQQSAAQGIAFPGPKSTVQRPKAGETPSAQQAVLRQTADAELGPQTLVQPDISDPVKLTEETPVPTVTIWTPKRELVTTIVAPLPEAATSSDVKPSLKAPNEAIDLADLAVSSSDQPTANHPILPSTTSPLVVHGPQPVQLAPVTTTQPSARPTPTAVMSISDLRMPDGTATLPPVNQTTLKNESGAIAPGDASIGKPLSKDGGGAGKDEGSGDSGQPDSVAGIGNGLRPGSGSGSVSGADPGPTTELIKLPKNGQFGAVVVGASLEERFPEISGIWNDRVAYTVYLHVGLAKSWILQYSLPRSAEAAEAGNITHLEAPWPYNIVRPNISPDTINSDALLVHGFVNQAGKFESLGVSFPPQFEQAQYVLNALNQWQFRPAAQNGHTERVEVLLIIPADQEE